MLRKFLEFMTHVKYRWFPTGSSSKPHKQMLDTANFAPTPKVRSCASSWAKCYSY